MRGYPALVDEGATVGVRVLETPAAQRAAMHAGTRRLLALDVPSPIRARAGHGCATRRSSRSPARRTGAPRAVLEDATVAALDALIAEAGGPAWDEAGFARLRDHVAGELAERDGARGRGGGARSSTPRATSSAARADRPRPALAPARATSSGSSRRLVYPGFVAATGARRLADVERYLRAAARRLERLPERARAATSTGCAAIHELEAEYEARVALAARAARCPRRCARSRGCSRSSASPSSPRRSAPAARCRQADPQGRSGTRSRSAACGCARHGDRSG